MFRVLTLTLLGQQALVRGVLASEGGDDLQLVSLNAKP